MIQAKPKLLTLDEFFLHYSDDRYQLIDGERIDVEPTEPHEQAAAIIGRKLNVEIETRLPILLPPAKLPLQLQGFGNLNWSVLIRLS